MIRLTSVLVFTALLATASLFFIAPIKAAPQHGFSVPQYERFHDLLHPLEHEALPKKDYRGIRAKAAQLVSRGRAIVKVGVPAGTSEDKREEFARELKNFERALNKFNVDARRGSNAKLKKSYTAVHDSYEMLAAMVQGS